MPHSRPIHMKFVKGSLAMLFNYLTEAFHENELCDLFTQYSDVFCLSNKFIVAQYRYVSRVWNIQRALNFMEMDLIDKNPLSVSFFFPLSLSLPHSLYPHCLFLSFTEGKKGLITERTFTLDKVKVFLLSRPYCCAIYLPQEERIFNHFSRS